MAFSEPAAFLSYAHSDDRGSGGGVRALADAISAEYLIITGRSLKVFVDSESISWGDEWQNRIDNALEATTFFIPVLSPTYFSREACRSELREFSGQAVSLGIAELILPILYAKVENFTADNPDEAVALASRLQYEDWTQLRLHEPASSEYKRGVHRMATRLAEAAHVTSERQSDKLTEAGSDSQNEHDFVEAISVINERTPRLQDLIDEAAVNMAQHFATQRMYLEKKQKLGPRRSGARLALLHRHGAEQLRIGERVLELSRAYASKALELNPYVITALRVVEERPEMRPFLDHLAEVLDEAKDAIDKELPERADARRVPVVEYGRSVGHLSNVWKRAAEVVERATSYVVEGNTITMQWRDRIIAVDSGRSWRRDVELPPPFEAG